MIGILARLAASTLGASLGDFWSGHLSCFKSFKLRWEWQHQDQVGHHAQRVCADYWKGWKNHIGWRTFGELLWKFDADLRLLPFHHLHSWKQIRRCRVQKEVGRSIVNGNGDISRQASDEFHHQRLMMVLEVTRQGFHLDWMISGCLSLLYPVDTSGMSRWLSWCRCWREMPCLHWREVTSRCRCQVLIALTFHPHLQVELVHQTA